MNALTASIFMALVVGVLASAVAVDSEPKAAVKGVVDAIKDEAKVPLLNKKIYIEKPIIKELPQDAAAAIDPSMVQKAIPVEAAKEEEDNVQLPPIPLIMPSIPFGLESGLSPFIQSIMNEIPMIQQQQEKGQQQVLRFNDEHEAQQRHFMSIVMLKHHSLEQEPEIEMPTMQKNILIMKIMPKHMLFGGDSDPDSEPHISRVHLLGGSSDPDNSRFFGFNNHDDKEEDLPPRRVHHLFGGQSESDRVHGHGYMTGGDQGFISSLQRQDMQRVQEEERNQHLTIFDKVKNFFSKIGHHQENKNEIDRVPPFMIRGEQIFIRKENHEHVKSKCHMFSFMRLHSSHYYQILIRLLFFSGLLTIILMVLAMMKAYRQKRSAAYRYFTQHDMNISSIDAQGKLKKETHKTSDFLVQDDLKVQHHPAPPPAYADEEVKPSSSASAFSSKSVTSQNSNSSLVNSLAQAYKSRYQIVASQSSKQDQSDTKSVKSLPPAYEDKQ